MRRSPVGPPVGACPPSAIDGGTVRLVGLLDPSEDLEHFRDPSSNRARMLDGSCVQAPPVLPSPQTLLIGSPLRDGHHPREGTGRTPILPELRRGQDRTRVAAGAQ